jgi:hypothetical protein
MSKITEPSIEERIAAALAADDATSSDLGILITEVEAAAIAADETATKAHQDALDPTKIVDAVKVGAAVATATLTHDRLQAALPRLREKHKEAAAIEYTTAWLADYDRAKAMRDELAAEIEQRYPVLAAELIALVTRIAPVDAEIVRVNQARPNGGQALQKTEETARGVTGFSSGGWTNGLLSLVTEMKLPKFKPGGDGYQYTYPPPQPTLAQQMIASGGLAVPYNPMYSPHWHEAIAARDAERRTEFDKAAAFSANQEAERERRRQAEDQEMLRRRQQQRGL